MVERGDLIMPHKDPKKAVESKSKLRNKIRSQKKKFEHGRFNLFDVIPQFDNPPPKKKVEALIIKLPPSN